MKKLVIILGTVLMISGCGSLKVNPKSCKSSAVWGSGTEQVDEKVIDLKAKERFYVFYDRDLRIRDLLEEHGIKCEEIKSLRIEISTTMFFLRKVSLKVVKNHLLES